MKFKIEQISFCFLTIKWQLQLRIILGRFCVIMIAEDRQDREDKKRGEDKLEWNPAHYAKDSAFISTELPKTHVNTELESF